MRDAKKDLEACERATPGPWYREKTGANYKGFSTETVIADTCPFATDNKVYTDLEGKGGSFPSDDADFIALAREALPYWISRALELEKVLRGYEQWEADLLMDDQAWRYEELLCFTQKLYDKWLELQKQRNKVLRRRFAKNEGNRS